MAIVWHNHHITPKHMGGTDDPTNIVRVNVAMHAFLHKCLYEEYGDQYDYISWKSLSGQISMSEASKLAIIEGARRGREKSWETHQERIKDGTHHFLGGEVSRKTNKKRVSNGTHHFIGDKNPSHKRLENGTHNFLHQPNPQSSTTTCPYCSKNGQYRAMKRWHFDNCRNK